VELTYGTERLAMYLQQVDNVFDLVWTPGMTYGDIHHQTEVQFSTYNFEQADVDLLRETFQRFESESKRLLANDLALPAYDYCIKTSNLFNLLDARGAISVAERTGYIARVRGLARQCAEGYLAERERLGYPLLHETRRQRPPTCVVT
jgi:glycyl-tRNA synthetase alpha chain